MNPNCKSCGRGMKLLFNGYYCENHCDLPADKAAQARKKDQEIAAAKLPKTGTNVATPVPAPVKVCAGCGKPATPRSSIWSYTGYSCANVLSGGVYCNADCPAPATGPATGTPNKLTINVGGFNIPVTSNPAIPSGGIVIPYNGTFPII